MKHNKAADNIFPMSKMPVRSLVWLMKAFSFPWKCHLFFGGGLHIFLFLDISSTGEQKYNEICCNIPKKGLIRELQAQQFSYTRNP